MLREKFNEIVVQEALLGFNRGIDLFLEELESDLEKDAIMESCGGIDNVLDYLVMESEQSK